LLRNCVAALEKEMAIICELRLVEQQMTNSHMQPLFDTPHRQ